MDRNMGYRVVVAGATGNVGREMLNILAEREFPADEIAVLASSRSAGEEVDFGESGRKLKIRNIEHFDPAGWDFALFAIGSERSEEHTSEHQSLMRTSYAVFCLNKKNQYHIDRTSTLQ